ncbi:MAG: SPOR domain-containing protein, partial [Muribaculaceae bacterium]|nr:SPOR domain-containing protein [Muribaculaceae bacterium]
LHFHDCVVVPEWGAFIVQRENASICVDSRKISAPRLSISFNPEIKHNDGLLASSIAQKECTSFEHACIVLKSEVNQLKEQFESKGKIDFGHVGSFVKENHHRVFYSNDSLINELYGECGLQDIKVAKLADLLVDSAISDNKLNRGRIYLRRVANYAAAVVILLGMIITLSTPTELNLTASEQASLNLLKKQDKLINDVESKIGELLISMPPINSVAQINIGENIDETVEPINRDFTLDRFFLVVASFPTQNDAERFIAQTKDNRLNFINMDGKFRVFVASAMDKESLTKMKTELKIADLYSDAWICKK